MAKEAKEQREIDRDEELARQKTVTDAVAKHELEARKEAEDALAAQAKYEVTGIRTVEGKP
jgi:CMP-N-acetylneuraminic acid synthetase